MSENSGITKEDPSVETGIEENKETEVGDVKKGKATQKRTRKKSQKTSKSKKKTKVKYNTDVHPETGAMQLQELLYYKLIAAEQQVKISERDVHIAKTQAKDFQTNANTQLTMLQQKIRENSNALANAKVNHVQTVNDIEKETGLKLKEWAVDDERVLRPLE